MCTTPRGSIPSRFRSDNVRAATTGYRSALIGAVLSALDGIEAPPGTMRVKRIDG